MPYDALPSLRVTLSHVPNGKPNAGRHSVAAVHHGKDSNVAFAIASRDHLELVDRDLHWQTTLLFADAFPNTAGREGTVQAIAVDNARQRLAAALDDHVAVWHKTAKDTYKVHSAFSTGFTVNCIDFHEETLLVAGSSLALYRLDQSSGLPLWQRTHIINDGTDLVEAHLSPDDKYIVTQARNSNTATVFRLEDSQAGWRLQQVCVPWHNVAVRQTYWLSADTPDADPATLVTETIDGRIRIWRCLPDEPHFFVLWLTLDPGHGRLLSVASYWLPVDGQLKLLSVIEDGSLVIHDIQRLHGSSSAAARFSRHAYAHAHLTRSQIASLKYSTARFDGSEVTIIGLSKSAALGLLRLENAFKPELANFRPWKYARIRHKQNVVFLVPAEDNSFMLTVGEGCETILWQARRLHDRTASLRATAIYTPSRETRPNKAAISQDGRTVAIATDQGPMLLTFQGRKLVPAKFSLPSFPLIADLLWLNFDYSNDGTLFLVAVDTSSSILAWRIDEHSAELLCRSALSRQASQATVTPQTASSAAKVAFVGAGTDGQICLGSLLLERARASYHESSAFSSPLRDITLLCCSTNNYIACVGTIEGSAQLRIVNTQSSMFTSGLEFTLPLQSEDMPSGIAFSNTVEGLPLLLVTFSSRLVVISQRRLDYYHENSMWTTLAKTDLSRSPLSVSAACITYGGSIAYATGNQIHLLSRSYVKAVQSEIDDMRANVHELNSVLPDYHPQLLVQSLLAGKHVLVNEILRRLHKAYKRAEASDTPLMYEGVALEAYMSHTHDFSQSGNQADAGIFANKRLSFSGESTGLEPDDIREIIQYAHEKGLPRLARPDITHLGVVLETHIQVEAQRRALDRNGMRFLLSLRSFAISHRGQSPPGTRSSSPHTETTGPPAPQNLPQMRWRDVLWAFHSESQEILLSACEEECGRPPLWEDAKRFCLPLWTKSNDALSQQLEVIARNEFTRHEDRDPTACSLYYFALRKKRLVQGLWRQATFHKERGVMMKFLMNDFNEPRWRSAAIKNAYALMSKHRFHYAAAFFLLGDSLKDCLNVCLRQLDDWQLAIMLARVYDGDNGPHLKALLSDHIIPMAFAKGYRRLSSWAFWMLNRRDLAVRVIVTPFDELLPSINNPNIKDIGTPGQEDPSLVLLYADLRDWSMQTLRGSWAIVPIRETQFITHISEAFCRMGCHPLALDLVCSWRFTSAEIQLRALSNIVVDPEPPQDGPDTSFTTNTRPLLGHHRRRSSLFQPKKRSTIIMDIPSALPSRRGSPGPDDNLDSPQPKKLDTAQREGLKKVLKEVKAPPPEFDMSSFGF